MEFFGVAAIVALIQKAVDWLGFLTSGHWRKAVTQAVAWLAGVVVVALFASSSATRDLDVGGHALGGLDWPGRVIVGLGLSSLASVVTDLKKPRGNNTDSAAVPPLGGERTDQYRDRGSSQVGPMVAYFAFLVVAGASAGFLVAVWG